MQLVLISARPAICEETVEQFFHYLPWLSSALVCVPERMQPTFRSMDRVKYVTDEEVTQAAAPLHASDHATRNTWLRNALVRSAQVEDCFIMADDDNRPLRHLDRRYFGEDGRDQLFYFYDLALWGGQGEDFDQTQHNSADVLRFLGLPTLAFGSHMPQIVRRELFIEAMDVLASVSDSTTFCEWSIYGNVASARHPERFMDHRPYEVVAWPQYRGSWPLYVTPCRVAFENFYPEMYDARHTFHGFDPSPRFIDLRDQDRHALAKLLEWNKVGRDSERLIFPTSRWDPWTRDSRLRRIFFIAMRRTRQVLRTLRQADWPLDRPNPTP